MDVLNDNPEIADPALRFVSPKAQKSQIEPQKPPEAI